MANGNGGGEPKEKILEKIRKITGVEPANSPTDADKAELGRRKVVDMSAWPAARGCGSSCSHARAHEPLKPSRPWRGSGGPGADGGGGFNGS